MRAYWGSLLIIGVVAAAANGTDRQDQLFASWQQAQRSVNSLVVEFSHEITDRIFEERQKAAGTFRLVRTPKGEVFASYDLFQPEAKADKQERWSGLLHKGTVYLLNHDKKTAIRFELADSDLRGFLEKYLNPFVLLLDQNRAREKCQVKVVKQDEWYTFVAVKPKQVKRFGWFPDTFHVGQVVVMNKASKAVPKDMPRQLWYTGGFREYTFEIKSWRLNAADGPKLEEFAKPEDRPGWEVTVLPFHGKK